MDRSILGILLAALWLGWLIYWGVASLRTKPTRRHESWFSRWSYIAPMIFGGFLLSLHQPGNPLTQFYLPPAMRPAAAWFGLACVALGFGVAIWARHHLAGNWSATVTLKENHELIRTGPYRWVRHPIYTGVLLALVGTALVGGRVTGLIGIGFFTASLMRKLWLEERWLAEVFPDYAEYRASVAALIPFIF